MRDLVASRERLRDGQWREAVEIRSLLIERELSEQGKECERKIRGLEKEAELERER